MKIGEIIPSDEVKNCLEKIDESSEYLLSLINDVLDLTHIESGKVKYNPVPARKALLI